MEKNETKEKKSNGVLVTVLIILLLIVFTCFGYAAGGVRVSKNTMEKVSHNVEEKEEEKKSSMTVYETTDEKVTKLFNTLFSLPGCGHAIELFVNDKKVENKDVTALQAYHMVQKEYWEKDSISLEDFQKSVHKYLGKDYNFDPTAVDYKGETCPKFNYDASTQTFKSQETACGWTCGPVGTQYLITKAVEENDVLSVTLRVVFGDNKTTFYGDYAHTKVLETNVNEYTTVPYEKGAAYKFTFKLEDGNYVFVSSALA